MRKSLRDRLIVRALVVAFVVAAPGVWAATAVRVVARGACTSGIVRVEPLCDGCTARPQDVAWIAHEGVADLVVDLDAAAAQWRVQARADGCWSASLSVATHAEAALLAIVPASRLKMTLQPPRGERAPEAVRIRVSSVRSDEIPDALVDCDRREARWHCTVPSLELDVRVSPAGFAPVHLFGVAPPHDAGALALRRGGSVAGRVEVSPRGSAEGVDVTIVPDGYGGAAQGRRAFATRTNSRGFFHFTGLGAGRWTVTAAREGWSPVHAEVTVEGGAEAVPARPLLLEPLAVLELAIEPRRDPDGLDWNVRLEHAPSWGQRFRVAERPAKDGLWTAKGLEAGMYIITVRNAAGAVVHQGGQVVSYGAPPLPIAIDVVAVRGRVTRAGEPIAARLDFLRAGGRKARLQSGEDGLFAGHLPNETRGGWAVKVTPAGSSASVHVRDVAVAPVDGLARVDLDLPDGRLAGKVVDESGNGLPSTLTFRRDDVRVVEARTASDGTFSLRGLPLGAVEIQASNRLGDSEPLERTLEEDEGDAIVIVTPSRHRVHATVVTPAGEPFAGALLRVLRSMRDIIDETSDPNGRFPIHSPAHDPVAHVIAIAPGHGATMQVLSLTGPADQRRIVLPAASGSVWLPAGDPDHWPFLAPVGLPLLNLYSWLEPPPAGSRRAVNGGRVLDLAPGTYRFCTDLTERVCVTHAVTPGSRKAIEFPR